jgi:hypothetical protein
MDSMPTAPMGPNPPKRPRFTSVTPYNTPDRRLSFWYASEWQLDEATSPHTCITLTPDPADPATVMTMTVQDMGDTVTVDDRSIIVEGVEDGLGQLDLVEIERMSDLDKMGDWGLEWVCTFVFDGQRRKRRARLFFRDRLQYSVMFQGSTEERFDYWKGMFEWTMLTASTAGFSLREWAEANVPDDEEGRD